MTKLKSKIIIASIFIMLNGIGNSAIYTVSNVNNTGSGSLRQAITDANGTAGSTITFSIPITSANVKGYNFAYFRISPASALPDITVWTCIDGSTERFYLGVDTNPYGCEIEINGASSGGAGYGLSISSKCNIIELAINGFSNGDGIALNENSMFTIIKGCYIGLSATGTIAVPNLYDGIYLTNFDTVNNITIGGTSSGDRNVISGNTQNGISEFFSGGLTNPFVCTVVGNYIGTDYTGLLAIPNGNGDDAGVSFASDNTNGHIIRNNVISKNNQHGILLGGGQSNTLIENNVIGLGVDRITKLGNTDDGIGIFGTVSGSTITNNVIAYNNYGIHLDNAGTPDPLRIFISSNSIYGNTTLGINNETGTNERITPPLIIGATTYGSTAFIEGTSSATARIEVFIASATQTAGQGKTYVGSTTASSGIWMLSVPAEYAGYMIANSSVTATQFVSRSGTSRFANNIRIRQGAVPVIYEKIKVTPRIMIY